jgi:hypothetical protein
VSSRIEKVVLDLYVSLNVVHTSHVYLAQLQFIAVEGCYNFLCLQKKNIRLSHLYLSISHSIHLMSIFPDPKSLFLILSHMFFFNNITSIIIPNSKSFRKAITGLSHLL